jgi:hypothetical protein
MVPLGGPRRRETIRGQFASEFLAHEHDPAGAALRLLGFKPDLCAHLAIAVQHIRYP